ncbi:MAG: hypothetical protein ACT4QA_01165 [Panacagrimonas sp.]
MRRPVPHAVFVGCVGLYVLVAGLGLWVVHLRPWLGFELVADEPRGLTVTTVDAHGPAQGLVRPGLRLLALAAPGAEALTLDPEAFRDPDTWRTWQEAASARAHLNAVHDLLRSGTAVDLHFESGERATVTPLPRTPLRAFAWELWLSLTVSAASFLCAAGVFAFRPEREPNRYFALAGALLMIHAVLAGAVSGGRLGTSGEGLAHLFAAIHFSEFALFACVAAMSSVFPFKLRFWRKLRPFMFVLAVFAAWLDQLRIGQGPAFVYGCLLLLAFGLVALPLAGQWWAQRRRPGRGRARGFVVALFCILGWNLVVNLVPLPMGDIGIERSVGAIGLNAAYVALGFLIYRYGLLDVDRWMLGAWFTFSIGLCLLLVDALVVYGLGATADNWSIAVVTIAILAWVYFPLRQAAWRFLAQRLPMRDLRTVSPLLFRRLLDTSAREEPHQAWRNLLVELFAPLRSQETEGDAPRPTLGRGGLELHIPPSCGGPALVLSYSDRGHRLFTDTDLHLVGHLAAVADRVHLFGEALEQGARAERQRVAQDLHDEVVPPLLSFIYRCDSRELAAEARGIMRELRSVVRELEGEAPPRPAGDPS